jgi:16S rRNA (guanine527-N7)-methyltransferase
VDKKDAERLREGALALGVGLSAGAAEALLVLRDELLRWNQRVNLTAITLPDEVLEKHFLDSLAICLDVPPGASVLDVGSGAGFPGLPLALARPDVRVTMVDAVTKKVSFVTQVAATLGIAGRVKGLHARLVGNPGAEGLPAHDVVVSRAFANLPAWLQLARVYTAPSGSILAMLGPTPPEEELRGAAAGAGLAFQGARSFALPWSHAPRTLARFGLLPAD